MPRKVRNQSWLIAESDLSLLLLSNMFVFVVNMTLSLSSIDDDDEDDDEPVLVVVLVVEFGGSAHEEKMEHHGS